MEKTTTFFRCSLFVGIALFTAITVAAFHNSEPTIDYTVTHVAFPGTGPIDITATGSGELEYFGQGPFGFSSRNRQILVTAEPEATQYFDIGYDGPLNDDIPEDIYWHIQDPKFVIQGVLNLSKSQELP